MKSKVFKILAVVSVLGLSLAACGGGENCETGTENGCTITTCCPDGAEDASGCTYEVDGTTYNDPMEAVAACGAE